MHLLKFRGVQPIAPPVASVLSFWLHIYWFFYKLFFFPKDAREDYVKTIQALDTPTKVGAWLFANVKYTSDYYPTDSWQPAERTFQRRAGDCEDYAIFANECLRNLYDCFFICMYSATSGHAELLVRDKTHADVYTSVGTFGVSQHRGQWVDLPPDWPPFRHFVEMNILDEDMKLLYEYP